jgi:mRNA deadenylase 3'-5' endonuclease subunit Ccr4
VSEPILVATAHLFWDPEFPDVKLIQTMLLTQELQRIAASAPQHLRTATDVTDDPPPLILVGDFNALPDSGESHYSAFVVVNLTAVCDEVDIQRHLATMAVWRLNVGKSQWGKRRDFLSINFHWFREYHSLEEIN